MSRPSSTETRGLRAGSTQDRGTRKHWCRGACCRASPSGCGVGQQLTCRSACRLSYPPPSTHRAQSARARQRLWGGQARAPRSARGNTLPCLGDRGRRTQTAAGPRG
eukprot:2428851-Rhodomonas_salina.2